MRVGLIAFLLLAGLSWVAVVAPGLLLWLALAFLAHGVYCVVLALRAGRVGGHE